MRMRPFSEHEKVCPLRQVPLSLHLKKFNVDAHSIGLTLNVFHYIWSKTKNKKDHQGLSICSLHEVNSGFWLRRGLSIYLKKQGKKRIAAL